MPDFFGNITIRACVLTADYRCAVTWEDDGSVWIIERSTGAARLLRMPVRSQVRFNRLLVKLGIAPLITREVLRARREQKALEKLMRESDELIVI